MKKILLSMLSIFFIFSSCKEEKATTSFVKFGEVKKLFSKNLNEERVLNIYLPEGYNPDSIKKYPTVYLLDGSENEDYKHVAGLMQYANMYDVYPKSIIVGIANVNRYRDFTYPSKDTLDTKEIPVSKSKEFTQFIKNEVQSFINKNYKTNNHKTIIGQSLGGLLATEILFKQPNLFNDYIIVSPSLWWDKFTMLKNAEKHLTLNNYTNKRVFLSVGKEHPSMNAVADKLSEELKKVDNITLKYQPLLEEDHATILHPAVLKAFKFLHNKEQKNKE